MGHRSKPSQGGTHILVHKLAGRLISFQRIIEEPLPPIEWVLEPLIAHQNRVVVFGEFASKKSWFLLDMGLHIAAGIKWLDQYEVRASRSVLYIDEEMSEYELRRRVQRLANGSRIVNKGIPFRATSHLGLKLFNEGKTNELLKALKSEGFDPDIVIVETLRRVLHGNENEAEDVSAFWQSVSPILAAGKTLIISHHMRKSNAGATGHEEARNRASGSTDILAGADAAFAITREKGDFLKVQCVKSRTAKEPDPFLFRLLDDEQTKSTYLTTDIEYLPAKPKMTNEASALTFIAEYYDRAGEGTIKSKDLYIYLAEKGIRKRSGERAHEKYRVSTKVETVGFGEYRKRMERQAAA
jgi:hypothetical protein